MATKIPHNRQHCVRRRDGALKSTSLGLLALALAAPAAMAQSEPVVTGRMRIEIDKRMHNARQINGRWWSEDNRELTRTNVGWLWQVEGGNARHLVRFDHHNPVDPAQVRLLDRSMGPGEVRRILGPPNSIFPSDRPEEQQQWNYYGLKGYKLAIHFSHHGGIFTAKYEPDEKSFPKDVPHLAFRFDGKTLDESYEERKKQRPPRQRPTSTAEFRKQLRAEMAERRTTGTSAQGPAVISGIPSGPSATPTATSGPASRKVTAQELNSVVIGMTRAELVAALGKPFSAMAITSAEGTRETLIYKTESGSDATIIVFKGKVSQLPR